MEIKYKIKLPNLADNKFLNKLRYEKGYNPFSYQFNKELNEKLLNEAIDGGANENSINIIRLGEYFNSQFHRKLSAELNSIHNTIQLPVATLMELFLAIMNEQELINKFNRDKFINSNKNLNAFDIQNGMFLMDNIPDNPQNYVGVSEVIIEFGNLFFTYITSKKNAVPKDNFNIDDQEVFLSLKKIFINANKYFIIRDHYHDCLFHNGIITLNEDDSLCFNACLNDMVLLRQISNTIVENQRLNRLFYYEKISRYDAGLKRTLNQKSSLNALSTVVVENGFVKYKLRKRVNDDYKIYLDYLVSVYDYYPFYHLNVLSELGGFTISELLQLFCELQNLVAIIYLGNNKKSKKNDPEAFKNNYLPRIKHSVLKSFLLSISTHSETQVELFIKLLTTKIPGNINLYETHLMRNSDYYYFSYFALTGVNHLYLIDFWLEQAKVSLEHRGKALENYIKTELKTINQNDINKFELINKSQFEVDVNLKEEIDILIQTKSTLIIGEVKCVKYPLYDRDYFGIYNDAITYAEEQLNRKTKFLMDYHNNFSDVYSLDNIKIIKVIILNYPIYVGGVINDIPLIDSNFFLSYFKHGKISIVSEGNDSREILESIPYYNNEIEFCDNFEDYLCNLPMVKMYSEKFKIRECSYKLDGLPKIYFTDVVPKDES